MGERPYTRFIFQTRPAYYYDHFHICFTKLNIYHLSFLSSHSATSTLLILEVCRTSDKYEPSIWSRSPRVGDK